VSSTGDDVLIGRSYTRARRSPLVIGKLPGAGRLPGGPYTITQIVTMVVVFVVLLITKAVWARFGPGDVLVLIVVPWGLAFTLRYARMDGRDPARALLGAFTYSSTPRAGRLAGRPVRPRRPRLLDTRITVSAQVPAAASEQLPARRRPAAAAPRPAAPAGPSTTGSRSGVRTPAARTALQALLAELGED
jgi:hypothetical protein